MATETIMAIASNQYYETIAFLGCHENLLDQLYGIAIPYLNIVEPKSYNKANRIDAAIIVIGIYLEELPLGNPFENKGKRRRKRKKNQTTNYNTVKDQFVVKLKGRICRFIGAYLEYFVVLVLISFSDIFGTMSFLKNSPRRLSDIEAASSSSGDCDEVDSSSDPFGITRTKNAPIERLKRWRSEFQVFHLLSVNMVEFRMQAALVLNASRRFRYTLDLKKEEEKRQILRKIRAHAQAIRAAYLFKEAAAKQVNGLGTTSPPPNPLGDFAIGQDQLVSISRDHNIEALQQYGGARGLSDLLKSNIEKGIHGDDADLGKRRNAFGSNNYPRKKGRSFLLFMWDACKDLTLVILMVAAAASLALGIKSEGIKEGWYDGGSIAFAVILVIVVTAISDYKQSLQFRDLNEQKRNIHLEVIRGGRRVEISIYDIVVGDVIPLNIGNQVPADGILITGHSLAIDESSMTGESKIIYKDSKDPFLMSGCKVADGSGTMLVTSVGINTEWGLLMSSISEDNGEETPLQVRLNGVATFIGIVGLSVAVAVLIVLLARYFSGHTRNTDGSVQFVAGKTTVSHAIDGAIKIITVAVTIVVVAVPEGLPLAVTLTLAYSMRKMMADKALVRRLSACETMGSATTICSDKTGTLTMNQMTVVEAYSGGKKIEPPDNKAELSPNLCTLILEGIAQNSNGSVYMPEGGTDIEVSGSPTEKAILHWGIKLGMNFEAVRSESSIIHVFPFNSDKKRGGVAVQTPDSQVHIHWKGAAEIVLACCTAYIDINGQILEMDEEKMTYFKKAIEDMAADSLRCVAIAYRLYEMEKVPTSEEELVHWALPESDLVLLAIVGLKDPCRPGVKNAVQLCQKAGVKVRMVTGDNVKTAKSIAVECGILSSFADATEPNIIEGRAFRALSDAQREDIAERISVMGRSSPNDKLLLVQALRRKGHVVAVTGDGTNDAPALHEADIGLAMGIQGTEVAKESSDIIILDDNFASVVKVVRWGRSVYANIQKFIQFQLTVNVAALVINVVAAVSSGDVPLNAVQLLWVNLIMDTLGALALATEPPTDHLMDRPPVGRREPLITNIMWRNLLIQAMYQVSVLLVLNFRGRSLLGLKHNPNDHAIKVKNTLIFNSFVLCQIFNEFNARKPDEFNIFKGVTKNYLFMGIVGLTLVLQILIIEFLGKFTSTVRLNWKQWLISVVIGFIRISPSTALLFSLCLSWPLAVLGKLIPVPETPLKMFFTRSHGRNSSKEPESSPQ
ncbi:calcium-transporting ATPase 8, plasma membrane-type [Senna tora]|uniref:Calcium-transporting ATPase n=2 Tax=Fabaceae TaxID=3803 RepID=A0A834X595_9FABA|nr:calcium-transporting ATPase 8, plasma membrane-type [Senna tora]